MLRKLIFSFTCLLDLPNYIVWNFLIEDLLKKLSVGIMIVLQSASYHFLSLCVCECQTHIWKHVAHILFLWKLVINSIHALILQIWLFINAILELNINPHILIFSVYVTF